MLKIEAELRKRFQDENGLYAELTPMGLPIEGQGLDLSIRMSPAPNPDYGKTRAESSDEPTGVPANQLILPGTFLHWTHLVLECSGMCQDHADSTSVGCVSHFSVTD